ncbi:efflux RND transporter periplasmic adaptor subunit [Aquibium carbonis]|uniref:Efflux RND transporter periplasmic adaptor subunit n=1 Tax=Aquibium carbonis TaxID=2495581 RepID=A0A3R9Y236_9HYPH|nr:efflux RND transporter periplasmic adaptor subunit [Aquibium carbonis]RST81164.1 efflux RND transporter periplasmic adaptor subunit [Aquibium carbonis]
MRLALLTAALLATAPAVAAGLTIEPITITEWKAVYGRIEARDLVPARSRIGGIVIDLLVTEGDEVKAGDRIATVRDDKIEFQIASYDAQLRALEAQLARAQSELERGQSLVDKGIATTQRLDQLRTDVDVALNQIASTQAQRSVVVQQGQEGAVLAPADGRVLTVPVTRGAVVMPGEQIASLGGGGFFLRLAIPERHSASLVQGASIKITGDGQELTGRMAKIYPQIDNGRVVADVEVEGLDSAFVDARVLVEVPVGERQGIVVPREAVTTRSGIDFVSVMRDGQPVARAVVLGEPLVGDAGKLEVLTGLSAGDVVALP